MGDNNQRYEDEVVAEIHAIRAKMLAECGGDHQKLMQHVRERQKASARKVLPAPTGANSTEQGVGPNGH